METIEIAKKPGRNKGGRPKKTLQNLNGNWKSIIIENMKEGASIEEIITLLDMSHDLYARMMREEPEFSETIEKGKRLSKAWWLKQGRVNMFSDPKSFSPQLWYMNMKNRFGWTDKQETNVNIQVPTSITIPQKGKTIRLLPPKKALAGADE